MAGPHFVSMWLWMHIWFPTLAAATRGWAHLGPSDGANLRSIPRGAHLSVCVSVSRVPAGPWLEEVPVEAAAGRLLTVLGPEMGCGFEAPQAQRPRAPGGGSRGGRERVKPIQSSQNREPSGAGGWPGQTARLAYSGCAFTRSPFLKGPEGGAAVPAPGTKLRERRPPACLCRSGRLALRLGGCGAGSLLRLEPWGCSRPLSALIEMQRKN